MKFFEQNCSCGNGVRSIGRPAPSSLPPLITAHRSLAPLAPLPSAHRSLAPLAPLPSAHRSLAPLAPLAPSSRSAFTLMEMLVVIVIISILIGLLGGAFVQARNHARRARAETQLRELLKAWTDYYQTYTNWPSTGNNIEMQVSTLQPLTAAGNPKGIAFLNFNIQLGTKNYPYYTDPWDHPYKVSFGEGASPQEVAVRIAVPFLNRDRYR